LLQPLQLAELDVVKFRFQAHVPAQNTQPRRAGEAQRIKLSRELDEKATGRPVYVLDEPTNGLHFADTAQLLEVLCRLVEAGSTVIVIEYNLDVIKTADWVIDLGPRRRPSGAQERPDDVAKVVANYTGQHFEKVPWSSVFISESL
jgi:excinuclease ABC subunit A